MMRSMRVTPLSAMPVRVKHQAPARFGVRTGPDGPIRPEPKNKPKAEINFGGTIVLCLLGAGALFGIDHLNANKSEKPPAVPCSKEQIARFVEHPKPGDILQCGDVAVVVVENKPGQQ